MSVRTDVINLQVNINGNSAQNQLNELNNKAKGIKLALDGMKKGTEEYIAKAAELATVNKEMATLKQQIGITALSQKELIAELNKLKALKGSVTPFSNEFKQLQKDIAAVESRLYDVRNGVQGFASVFSKVKDEVKQFGAVALGYLGFQFLAAQFSNIISGAGKLSDQLADLRRVAGLTEDGANQLNKSLSKIDTRTSVSSLRDIAIIAGKLGVAKEDILGFTQAVDQLVVALGDELGDADQITTQLGKILNVFDGKVTGENITKLGNAFVVLANSGVATGSFLSEFDQRLAGTAKSANISLGALTGLGAGLEETGSKVEASSTAIQKLVNTIGVDIPKAAKIAGAKSAEEIANFADLFAKKPEEAIIRFAEGLTKNKSSFAEIASSFKDAGEEGARTVAVLQAIGQKGDFMREKIALGNKALQETSAISEAFALKNENFGATLAKLGKEFNSLVSSSGISSFFKGITEGAIGFINVLKSIPKFIDDHSTALKLLAAGLALANLQYIKSALVIAGDTLEKITNAIVTRTSAIATSVAGTATAYYSTIVSLSAGTITKATAAQRLWTIATTAGLGPFGLLIGIIGAAILIINSLTSATSKAAITAKTLKEIQDKAADSYSDQVQKIREYTTVLNDNNVSQGTKAAVLKDLIALNPEVLKGLNEQNVATAAGKKIIDEYVTSLKNKAYYEAASEVQKDSIVKDLKLAIEQKNVETEIANGDNRNITRVRLESIKKFRETVAAELDVTDKILKEKYEKAGTALAGTALTKNLDDSKEKVAETIKDLQDKIKKLQDELLDLPTAATAKIAANLALTKQYQDELDKILHKKNPEEKKNDADLKRLDEEAKRFQAELKKLAAEASAGTKPEYDKEIALVEEKYKELLGKAKLYWKKNSTLGKEASAEIEKIREDQLDAVYKKFFQKGSEDNYKESLQEAEDFVAKQKAVIGQSFIDGKLTKQEYEAAIAKADEKGLELKVNSAKFYSSYVKAAATDLTGFLKLQLDKQVTDAIAAAEKKKKATIDDTLAEGQLEVLKTKKGSAARLEAEKTYLKLKYELTEKNADDTLNMRLLKEKQYEDAVKELDKQDKLAKIDKVMQYVGYFQQAMESINTILNNQAAREIAKDKKINEDKQKTYKHQLDNKLLSQGQYDKAIAKLADDQDKREKQIQREQAKRQKALAIFNALVNTGAAIVKMLADPGGFAGLGLSIAAGITGALQIASIASAPLPELGRGGLLQEGPKHRDAQKGLHVVNPITGKTEMYLERNEAVLTSAAMDSNRRMTVSGTPKQIASAINSTHGGVSFAGGAVISMKSSPWAAQPQPSIRAGIVRMMAQGGLIGGSNSSAAADNGETLNALIAVVASNEAMREDLRNFNGNLKAHVVYKDLVKAGTDYNAAKTASGV